MRPLTTQPSSPAASISRGHLPPRSFQRALVGCRNSKGGNLLLAFRYLHCGVLEVFAIFSWPVFGLCVYKKDGWTIRISLAVAGNCSFFLCFAEYQNNMTQALFRRKKSIAADHDLNETNNTETICPPAVLCHTYFVGFLISHNLDTSRQIKERIYTNA